MDNNIVLFLHNNQLSADFLLLCQYQLKLCFQSKGFVLNEDILQSVTAVAPEISFSDLEFYSTILSESFLPIADNYQATLELFEDTQKFLYNVFNVIYSYSEGVPIPSIRAFEEELSNMFATPQQPSYHQHHQHQSHHQHHQHHQQITQPNYSYQNNLRYNNNPNKPYHPMGGGGGGGGGSVGGSVNGGYRNNYGMRGGNGMYPQPPPSPMHNMGMGMMRSYHPRGIHGGQEDFGKALQRISLEKQPSICRLQALLRKNGMEIIFPQAIHDTVSLSFFLCLFCLICYANNTSIYIYIGISLCLCSNASCPQGISSSITSYDFTSSTILCGCQ